MLASQRWTVSLSSEAFNPTRKLSELREKKTCAMLSSFQYSLCMGCTLCESLALTLLPSRLHVNSVLLIMLHKVHINGSIRLHLHLSIYFKQFDLNEYMFRHYLSKLCSLLDVFSSCLFRDMTHVNFIVLLQSHLNSSIVHILTNSNSLYNS